MSELFQPGQHPDADQLSAFAERALPANEQELMLVHLAHCARCREIAYLAQEAALEELTPAHLASAHGPGLSKARIPGWFSGWNLAWAAGAAIACLIVLGVQLQLFTARKNGATPLTVASNLPASKIAAVASQATPGNQTAKPKGKTTSGPLMKVPTRKDVDANSEPVTTTISPEMVGSATLTGQNAAELVRMMPAPATSAENPVAAENPVVSMKSQAAAGAMTVVTGADAEVPIDTAEVSATLKNELVDSAVPSQTPLKLPSHLAAVSTVSNGRIALAIDSAGALFASKDAGKHWKAVSPQWAGRPVRVAYVSARQPEIHAPAIAPYNQAATVRSAPAPTASPAPAATANPASGAEPLRETLKAIPTGNSTVSGIVTDQTGARIPGARVTLIKVDSGDRRDLRTDQNGSYAFDRLVPGEYALELTAKGFSPGRQTGIQVSVSQPTIANAMLKVGAENAAVTVVSEPMALQTDSNTVSTTIKEEPVTAGPELFQLTTDTGAVWTSPDGRHWKRK